MELKQGIYRHFKGNRYELLYVAKHSETLEEMVVYRALYGDQKLWVRPAYMWEEEVEVDGKKVISDKRVLELFNEQKKTFAERAIIRKDVYTDGEGVSYNGVVWL